MKDIDFARRVRVLRSGCRMAVLGLALTSLGGCLFLSPDDENAGLRIEMIARADRDAPLAKRAVDPTAVLASDGLIGRGTLSRTSPGVTEVETTQFPLTVGPLVNGEREVNGVLDFDLGPVGSTYSLQAELLYLGTEITDPGDRLDPAGNWQGEIGFDAGDLQVQIEQLTLVATATPNVYNGTIRLTHPSLNTQEIPSVPLSGVVFDPATGAISLSYRAPDPVQWDESTEEPEVIQVRFDGSFAPTVAFVRTDSPNDVIDLVPGGGVIQVELGPVPGGIVIGQRIVGTLQVAVHENDGSGGPGALILGESGAVAVGRLQLVR